MTDLSELIDRAIPEGRRILDETYTSLEGVAAHCEANYLKASDKRAALEETKHFTIQSLASLAYHINTLAVNVLNMLEIQTGNIKGIESKVNHISQMVKIHKEKVARREIGALAANRTIPNQYKIVTPMQPEIPVAYIRRPIDYSLFDNLGHAVKSAPLSDRFSVSRSLSATGKDASYVTPVRLSGSSGYSTDVLSAPSHLKLGSVSRGSSAREYRTPLVAVAPPTIPGYSPDETNPLQRVSSVQRSSYERKLMECPNRGDVRNMRKESVQDDVRYSALHSLEPPPPAPALYGSPRSDSLRSAQSDAFPPPPDKSFVGEQYSPPLPPPPASFDYNGDAAQTYGTDSSANDAMLPDWVPPDYIEKVIAIYDYAAEKMDELSFQENAVIYVLKKNEDGWFEGVMDGVTGLFPGNYVEPCL